MKTATLVFDDFFELMGAAGSAVGALKALADGNNEHLPPEELKKVADRLNGAAMEAAKNSDTYK